MYVKHVRQWIALSMAASLLSAPCMSALAADAETVPEATEAEAEPGACDAGDTDAGIQVTITDVEIVMEDTAGTAEGEAAMTHGLPDGNTEYEAGTDRDTMAGESELSRAQAGTSITAGTSVPGQTTIAGSQGEGGTYECDTKLADTWAREPEKDASGVYVDSGELSRESLENALALVNYIRSVAGLPAVTLSEVYNQYCQDGVLVMDELGRLGHYPSKPDGVSDELYESGYKGTSSSNIAYGFDSLSEAILGWMNDGDSSNVDILGHRRWVLNERMSQTGFGATDTYYAMYAVDRGADYAVSDYVAWPAKNMPVELMCIPYLNGRIDDTYPWSVSIGRNYRIPDASKVVVTMVDKVTGKTYTFDSSNTDKKADFLAVSKASKDGSYGSGADCIIFRPGSIQYKVGDSFDVSIAGLTDASGNAATLSYSVNLFSVDAPASDESTEGKPGDPGTSSGGDAGNTDKPSGENTGNPGGGDKPSAGTPGPGTGSHGTAGSKPSGFGSGGSVFLGKPVAILPAWSFAKPDTGAGAPAIVGGTYAEGSVDMFFAAFEEEFAWDLLPYDFLYDLYQAWLAEGFPYLEAVDKDAFIGMAKAWADGSDTWEYDADDRKVPSEDRMDKEEELIQKYHLSDWEEKDGKAFTPEQEYLGLVRIEK